MCEEKCPFCGQVCDVEDKGHREFNKRWGVPLGETRAAHSHSNLPYDLKSHNWSTKKEG